MGPQAMQILFGEKTRNIYLQILKIFSLLNIVVNKSSGFIFVRLEAITSHPYLDTQLFSRGMWRRLIRVMLYSNWPMQRVVELPSFFVLMSLQHSRLGSRSLGGLQGLMKNGVHDIILQEDLVKKLVWDYELGRSGNELDAKLKGAACFNTLWNIYNWDFRIKWAQSNTVYLYMKRLYA